MKHTILSVTLILFFSTFPLSEVASQNRYSRDSNYAPPDRSELMIPEVIWQDVLDAVDFSGIPLGYTSDEMRNYSGSGHILPNIEMLFRDILSVPRFSGRLSTLLTGNPSDFGYASLIAYNRLGTTSAREAEFPGPGEWGVDWIDDGTSHDAALEALINRTDIGIGSGEISDDELAQWSMLPPEIQLLVLRTIISAYESAPVMGEAFDRPLLRNYFGVEHLSEVPMSELYDFASAPWQEDVSPIPRESFDALDRVDFHYLACASNTFLSLLYKTVNEYLYPPANEHGESEPGAEQEPRSVTNFDLTGFESCEFRTSMGLVGIFGPGADSISGDYSFIFDLGGNDVYTGTTAVPRNIDQPFGIVIDLSGYDVYRCDDTPAGLACGNHGIGGIIDIDGNDQYFTVESGIACAWYGTGFVIDYAGDDIYNTTEIWGQGAAHAGAGLLIDLSGDDYYNCLRESQGFGSTLGFGLILDTEGSDDYFADPFGDPQAPGAGFTSHTVSFAQGTGFGRRADFGDGHSLAGGFGVLIDGAGDDTYTGGVYSQGAGYWWAMGILEDLGGNDTYRNDWYSAGSAPHFAIGSCVDLSGDDLYNIGNTKMGLQCQAQGCARDGSIAVFIDGAGDDCYYHRNRCAGSGDLNSIALFWDRLGDDSYLCDRNGSKPACRSYGDATWYERFNTFRDDVPTVGVYLDTSGIDTYEEIYFVTRYDENGDEIPFASDPLEFANDVMWQHRSPDMDGWPRFRSVGIDVDWFSGILDVTPSE